MTKEELAQLIAALLNTPDERTRPIETVMQLDEEPNVVAVDLIEGKQFFVEVTDV